MANELIALRLLVGMCLNFDIYFCGYIQTYCQKNKKIKRADQMLPEVYGTTLSYILWCICSQILLNYLVFQFFIMNVPDEGYSRNIRYLQFYLLSYFITVFDQTHAFTTLERL